jgi:hypothetical protein
MPMTEDAKKHTPWIFLPFVALWRLLTLILELTGRVVAVVIGLILMIGGGLLTVTVIGAPIGIPLALFGFLLLLRGLF